jgi:WD40 repeat protein
MNKFISICFLSIICLVLLPPMHGQSTTSPITLENIENLTMVQTLGTGSRQLSFSPDGQIAAVLSTDETSNQDTIVFWDVETLQQVNKLQIPDISISRVIFHPDGTSVLIGTTTGRILIWQIDSEQVTVEWQAHQSAISLLQIHPNGKVLVTGNESNYDIAGKMTWWDLQQATSSTEIQSYAPQMGGTPTSGLFFLDGDWFVAGIGLRTYVWDTVSEQPSNILTGQLYFINDMDFIPNMKRLALISEIRIMLWDMESLFSNNTYRYDTVIANPNANEPYALTSIDASADGQLLITGDSNGMLNIWRTDTLELVRSIPAYERAIGMVRMNANYDTVFVVSQETDDVQVWRIVATDD